MSESLKKSKAKKGVRKKIQTQAPQVQQKKTKVSELEVTGNFFVV